MVASKSKYRCYQTNLCPSKVFQNFFNRFNLISYIFDKLTWLVWQRWFVFIVFKSSSWIYFTSGNLWLHELKNTFFKESSRGLNLRIIFTFAQISEQMCQITLLSIFCFRWIVCSGVIWQNCSVIWAKVKIFLILSHL